jgi:hypothetical protein
MDGPEQTPGQPTAPGVPLAPAVPPAAAAQGPWVGGVQAAASTRERARSSRRVVERFVVLMLLATLGVVIVAALPAIVRLVQGDGAEPARRGIARLARARGWAVAPPDPVPHPAFAPEDLGARRRGGDPLRELLRPEGIDPADPADHVGAVARTKVVLRDRADADAPPVAEIEQGQVLLVVQDAGDWLLVAARADDRMRVGWAQRSQLTLLR